MNNNNLAQALQQGFHITVGAITSFVETAQNPEKRTEVISELQMELNQKTREWAVKGETTEQEGRRVLDNFLRQRNWQPETANSNRSNSSDSSNNSTELSERNTISSGLQQLQDEIVALRTELAKMRE
jgi:polyhydroxyalkanoate synthesis regulator phasin